MNTETSPAENRGQAWWAWRHGRGSYRAAPDVPPGRYTNSPTAGWGSGIAARPKVALGRRDNPLCGVLTSLGVPDRMAEGTAV